MKYRKLGKTGLNVSVIGLGTWQLGGEWGKNFTQDEVNAMLRRGQELGINFIDTAEGYGDHLSESLSGTGARGSRGKWSSGRACGHPVSGFGKARGGGD